MFSEGKRYYKTLAVYAFLGLDIERISQIPSEELKDTYVTHIGVKMLRLYAQSVYPKVDRNYILLIGESAGKFNVSGMIDRMNRDFCGTIVVISDQMKDGVRYCLLRKRGLLKYVIPEEDEVQEEEVQETQ